MASPNILWWPLINLGGKVKCGVLTFRRRYMDGSILFSYMLAEQWCVWNVLSGLIVSLHYENIELTVCLTQNTRQVSVSNQIFGCCTVWKSSLEFVQGWLKLSSPAPCTRLFVQFVNDCSLCGPSGPTWLSQHDTAQKKRFSPISRGQGENTVTFSVLVKCLINEWFMVSDSTVCTFRSSSVGSCVLLSLPEYRRGGWTGRSCSSHLPADPLHPEHDSWNAGGLQVRPWPSFIGHNLINSTRRHEGS